MSAPRLLLRSGTLFALSFTFPAVDAGADDLFATATATAAGAGREAGKQSGSRGASGPGTTGGASLSSSRGPAVAKISSKSRVVSHRKRQMWPQGGESNERFRGLLRGHSGRAGQAPALNEALFENGEKNHDVHG